MLPIKFCTKSTDGVEHSFAVMLHDTACVCRALQAKHSMQSGAGLVCLKRRNRVSFAKVG